MRAATLLLLFCWGQDDPRVEWLRKNAVAVRSIDPADTDFKDLEPLRDMIGKARIVQLGEQTHGDGAAFLAKIRLIKFLHERMGFDVIAWESGLFDCRKAWEKFKAGDDPVKAAQTGIFGIWTQSEEVRPLFKYLAERAKTDKPLELCGFDCQFTARGSTDSLLPDLESALGKVAPPPLDTEQMAALKWSVKMMIQPPLEEKLPSLRVPESVTKVLQAFRGAVNAPEFSKAVGEPEAEFWKQMGESLTAQADVRWSFKTRTPEGTNVRDGQMARNLIWLAENKYPGRKIIVWAATFHLMRNASSIEAKGMSYEKTIPMGHLVSEKFGEDVFTLGFTAYEGRAANPWSPSFPLAKPPDGSLEHLCVKAGLGNAVICFRHPKDKPAWLGEKLSSRPLGYMSMRADWTNVLDGMVFTRRMTPSTPADTSADPLPPDQVENARDLMGNLDQQWANVIKSRETGNPWEHKVSFGGLFDRWKRAVSPDDAGVALMEKSIVDWRAKRKEEPGSDWRCDQLLAEIAASRKDGEAAARLLDRALAAYPDLEVSDPNKHSSFQHLVNQRALLIWDAKGFDAALEYAATLLERERKFAYVHPGAWDTRLRRERKVDGMDELVRRVRVAYDRRAKAFPRFADQAGRYKAALK